MARTVQIVKTAKMCLWLEGGPDLGSRRGPEFGKLARMTKMRKLEKVCLTSKKNSGNREGCGNHEKYGICENREKYEDYAANCRKCRMEGNCENYHFLVFVSICLVF